MMDQRGDLSPARASIGPASAVPRWPSVTEVDPGGSSRSGGAPDHHNGRPPGLGAISDATRERPGGSCIVLQEQERGIRVFVLSPIRIYSEGLSHVLAEEPTVQVMGTAAMFEEAVAFLRDVHVDVMLFDLAVDPGLVGLRLLSSYEGLRVLALGVAECEDSIIACAEAGIAGYVTPATSLEELVRTIREAARGEFSCPPRIVAGLLRRLAAIGPPPVPADPPPRLTLREREILKLIEQGESNKEIGRHLGIEVATVKNHVHNILEKSGVTRRADAVAMLRSYRVLGHA